jgi:hypothetical protein
MGIASGTIGLAIGASRLDDRGARRTLGIVDVTVGAVSAALGLHQLFTARTVTTVANHAVSVQPIAAVGPQSQRVGLHVRF